MKINISLIGKIIGIWGAIGTAFAVFVGKAINFHQNPPAALTGPVLIVDNTTTDDTDDEVISQVS